MRLNDARARVAHLLSFSSSKGSGSRCGAMFVREKRVEMRCASVVRDARRAMRCDVPLARATSSVDVARARVASGGGEGGTR